MFMGISMCGHEISLWYVMEMEWIVKMASQLCELLRAQHGNQPQIVVFCAVVVGLTIPEFNIIIVKLLRGPVYKHRNNRVRE